MKTSKLFQKFMQQQDPGDKYEPSGIPGIKATGNIGNSSQAASSQAGIQKGSFMNYKSRMKTTPDGSVSTKADKVSALDKSKASIGGHQAQIMSESEQY